MWKRVLSISAIRAPKGDSPKCTMRTPSDPPNHPSGLVFCSGMFGELELQLAIRRRYSRPPKGPNLKRPRVFSNSKSKPFDILKPFPLLSLALHHLSVCDSSVCDFKVEECFACFDCQPIPISLSFLTCTSY
ncbi:hypothetical protein RDI58_015813 [Solanum bulbocastanum]|uniref:Uncharacterized protein n=1 Tax=Solanum bulbocastanum TaxID=147425 RepID=A0AAN8YFC4_SOLBU